MLRSHCARCVVSKQTAYETGPVSAAWPRDQFHGLPTTLDRIRIDRYLEELLTHGPDPPLHCQAVFGVSAATAVRYAAAAAALQGTSIDEAFKNRPSAGQAQPSRTPAVAPDRLAPQRARRYPFTTSGLPATGLRPLRNPAEPVDEDA